MTAHDVRQLRVCPHCRHLGDRRDMVKELDGYLHGACYIALNGLDDLLKLPTEELEKLTLADIGPATMRAILDQRNKAKA